MGFGSGLGRGRRSIRWVRVFGMSHFLQRGAMAMLTRMAYYDQTMVMVLN